MRYAQPQILWGTNYENVLELGIVDNRVTSRLPRGGSEQIEGVSGIIDSWITGWNYTLTFDTRWIPSASLTNPYIVSGWSGPTGFQAFLDWARQGNTFRYVPDRTQATFYVDNCYLAVPWDQEASLEDDGTFKVSMTLVQSVFDFGLAERGLAFEYTPGASLTDPLTATFTRASTAWYFNQSGYYAQAAINELRDRHYVGGQRTTLLEETSTNEIHNSCDISQAGWGQQGTLSLSAATPLLTGQTAKLFTNGGVTGSTSIFQTAGTWSGANGDTFYAILENVSALTTRLLLYDNTTSTQVYQVEFTWATGGIASILGTGTMLAQKISDRGPNGGAVYLLAISTVGPVAGNARRGYIYPTGVSVNTNAVVVHHVQMESNTLAPSSPIPTVNGSVTRSADSLSYPFTTWAPQGLWFYVKFIEGSVGLSTPNAGKMTIGGSGSVSYQVIDVAHQVQYRIQNQGPTSNSNSTMTVTPVNGDTIEILGVVFADGSTQVFISKNGAADIVGTHTGAFYSGSAWYVNTLYLGQRGTPSGGRSHMGLIKAKVGIGAGVLSLDAARAA